MAVILDPLPIPYHLKRLEISILMRKAASVHGAWINIQKDPKNLDIIVLDVDPFQILHISIVKFAGKNQR